MSDALATALLEMKERREEKWRAKGKGPLPLWVFCGQRRGMLLGLHNVKSRHFFRCLEKAKLPRMRFHDLRHTFASLLLQAGEPIPYVKEQLGHSSIKTTVDVYGHLAPGVNRQAVNRLPTLDTPSEIVEAVK
jgi:integrase